MRKKIRFNDHWQFENGENTQDIRLPHTAVELPYAYFDETSYQKKFVYRKIFSELSEWQAQRVCLLFDGVMANAKVFLNDQQIAAHADGYTPFIAPLNDSLKKENNELRVEIDGTENPEIPPFGGQIDYLTYAGIYRDVWLLLRPQLCIDKIKIETPDPLGAHKTVLAKIFLECHDSSAESVEIRAKLLTSDGSVVAEKVQNHTPEACIELVFSELENLGLWDINDPILYTLQVTLNSSAGKDQISERFGFREAKFTPEGFFLNGRALKIRGLNRHQSFPYVGYALGKAAQEHDADILKYELRLNTVRTSHYPQSKYFLDRCDEIGLLVFEEIPGWQFIGGEQWQAQAVENVRGMIERDWNHPSIIIWGVRINESADNHGFYTKTNTLAHELDSTRQTGGVRCIQHSELLEDVYTMNDFIMGEQESHRQAPRRGLRPQQEITGKEHKVPYLVTEYNGHMFPTKSTDNELRLAEHSLRHLEVLNAAYGDPNISGCIGWCAFDYNTHADFGSGDRICHHGVMDMFREPKFAAYAYASQSDPEQGVMLKPVTYWARGERDIGGVLPLLVLTNCDSIEMQYGDDVCITAYPDRQRFPHLPHPPVIIQREHFKPDQLGSWGMNWERGVIRGYINNELVETVEFSPAPLPTTLEVIADQNTLTEYESVRIMVRALDQCGNKLPFLSDPVSIDVQGQAKLIGPAVVPLRGGTTGFWLQAGAAGMVKVTISHQCFASVTLDLEIQTEPHKCTGGSTPPFYGSSTTN